MKKGLLLSVVASTMIFAGGDIAPIEPVVPAPAADCSEWSGKVGLYYRTVDNSAAAPGLFSDALSELFIATTLKYEGEVTNGVGIGIELGAVRMLNESTNPALVNGPMNSRAGAYVGTAERAEISQMYLSYAMNNTAIKAGRFELPCGLSQMACTGRANAEHLAGQTFEGLLFANTDLADTTVYGAALSAVSVDSAAGGRVDLTAGDMAGLYALGLVNTSIADTTIQMVGYYQPDEDAAVTDVSVISGAATVTHDLGNGTKVTAQAAFASDSVGTPAGIAGTATNMFAAKVDGSMGPLNLSVRGWYLNNGTAALANGVAFDSTLLASSHTGAGIFGTGVRDAGARLDVNALVGPGKLSGRVEYHSYDVDVGTAGGFARPQALSAAAGTSMVHARVGYTLPIMENMDAGVEYRYTKFDLDIQHTDDVRAQVTYKF